MIDNNHPDRETLSDLYAQLARKDEEYEQLSKHFSLTREKHLEEECALRQRIVQLEAERDAAGLHPSHDDVMLEVSRAIRSYSWAVLAELAEGTDLERPLQAIARVEKAFHARRGAK